LASRPKELLSRRAAALALELERSYPGSEWMRDASLHAILWGASQTGHQTEIFKSPSFANAVLSVRIVERTARPVCGHWKVSTLSGSIGQATSIVGTALCAAEDFTLAFVTDS
jgi:hypothetical protein